MTLSLWSPLPEINLSTRDTRGGRLPDRYDAGVELLPLEAAYDAADGCHKTDKAIEPGFSRSANRSYRHISYGYGSWKGISTRGLARRAEKDLAKLLSFASRCARAPRTPPRAAKVLRVRPSCLIHRRATKGLRASRTPPHHNKRTRCRAVAAAANPPKRRAAPRRRRVGGARPARRTRARAAAAPPRAPRRGPWPSSPRRRRFQCRLDQL